MLAASAGGSDGGDGTSSAAYCAVCAARMSPGGGARMAGGSGEASVTGGMAGLAESGWAVSAESPSKVGQDRSSADSRRLTRFSVQNQDLSSAVTFADGVRPLAVGSAELKGGLRWAHKPTGDARCHLILCLRAGRADVKKRTLEWTAAQAAVFIDA